MWQDFVESMGRQRKSNEETIGFFKCGQQSTSDDELILGRDFFVPSPEEFVHQGRSGLELSSECGLNILNMTIMEDCHLLQIHTHPGNGTPTFSAVDDNDEQEYSRFISELRPNARFISAVFNEDFSKSAFREWRRGEIVDCSIALIGDGKIETAQAANGASSYTDALVRQAVFGQEFRRKLKSMSIGLVGCGGIGAVFAEQLARLGVSDWVLVDPDRIEFSNLNRFPFATTKDVSRRAYKATLVARNIRRFWGENCDIDVIRSTVENKKALRNLARCDLIVAATDDNFSRVVLQKHSSKFIVPLLNLASDIDAAFDGQEVMPSIFCRISLPPLGTRRWCLVCGDIINLQRAAAETTDGPLRDAMVLGGYLPDEPAPAVYWVNSLCAAVGVGLVHEYVMDQGILRDGKDILIDASEKQLFEIDHEVEGNSNCLFCSGEKGGYFGLGDL